MKSHKDFYEIMGYNPAERPDCETSVGQEYPIVCLAWEETIEFVNQLSRREGLTPCYTVIPTEEQNAAGPSIIHWRSNVFCEGYRLPTDDEWKKIRTCQYATHCECRSKSQQR